MQKNEIDSYDDLNFLFQIPSNLLYNIFHQKWHKYLHKPNETI